jgi:hypothetical protein
MNMIVPQMQLSTFHCRAMVSAPKRSAHKTKLPSDFVPGTHTVICGRGKSCSKSPGNKHLRSLVNSHLTPYSMAKNKAEKSIIVSAIVDRVREDSPVGAFIKQEDDGEWWEVDDSFAREKIGCIFRDILHTKYRSSTKAKQARKKSQEDSEEGSKKTAHQEALSHSSRSSGSNDQDVSHAHGQFSAAHTSLYIQNAMSKPHTVHSMPNSVSYFSSSKTTAGTRPFLTPRESFDPLLPLAEPTVSLFNNGQKATGAYLGNQLYSEENRKKNFGNFAMMPYGSFRRPRFDIVVQKQGDSMLRGGGLLQSTFPADIKRKAHSLLQEAIGVVVLDGSDILCVEDFPDDLSDIFDD